MDLKIFVDKTKKDAASGGYLMNPDDASVDALCEGILTNIGRYGYGACPCRKASGVKAEDLDIICPCDYRDPDINEFGACYCSLYVSKEVPEGKKPLESIPERRPPISERNLNFSKKIVTSGLPLPVWRCRVCGYLCAREAPPDICPICKVDKERFERFM